jgi:hypothetical protein
VPAAAAQASAAPAGEQAPAAPVAPEAPPVERPRVVRIPVRGKPANAELIAADGKVLAGVGRALELPAQDGSVELVASAPGFLSERILVDPARDQEIVVHLKKVRNATKAPGEPEKRPEVLPDMPVRF